MMSTSSADEPIQTDVRDLRRDVESALMSARAEIALQWLPPPETFPADRAKVVVVGEVGTGKTQLINAVLNRRDMLPATATKTYVGVGAGETEELRVHLHDGNVTTGRISDIGQWMQACRNGDAEVAHIEVVLDEPWLAALSLFDTPGVGATDTAATALTLDALREATALVFVCSAEAKISLPEREFLRDATKRIDQVVFVLSKVDLLDDLGHRNLREDEETVRTDCRFPPNRFGDISFLPFSAVLAAEGAGDEQALIDSGVAELRRRLEAIAASHGELLRLNELRSIRSALSEGFRYIVQRQQRLVDPATVTRLEDLQTRYREVKQQSGRWREQFVRKVDAARGDVLYQFRRDIRDLSDRYERRLGTNSREQAGAIETALVEDLCNLQRDTATGVKTRIQEIVCQTLSLAGVEGDAADMTVHVPDPRHEPSDYIGGRLKSPGSPGEGMRSVQALYIAQMMAKNIHLGPLAPVAGMGWYLLQRRLNKRAHDLADLRSWITRSINEAQHEIADEVGRAFQEAGYLLVDPVNQAFRRALDALADESQALSGNGADIDVERKRLEEEKGRIVQLTRRCELQARVGQLCAPPAPDQGSPGS